MAENAVGRLEHDDGGIVGGPLIETGPKGRGLGAARALLVGMLFIQVGGGLQGVLLGVRTESEGFGLAVSGIVMAAFYLGFMIGTRLAEHFLAAVGHIRVFAALASVASAVSILHLLWINPAAWALLRMLFGLCIAGVLVVVESWLNDMATNATRGRLLSMYMVSSMGGLTLGQLLLNGGDPFGFELFVISSVLISAALVPITLSATSAPPLTVPEPLSLRQLISRAPTGVVTAFCSGISHGTLLGVGAVYAAYEGLPPSRIALFLVSATAGAIAFQWPVGSLSDRVSRRAVIFAAAAVAAAIAGILPLIKPGSGLSLVLVFCFGGATFPLYSLAIALTGDWVPSSQLNGASAALVRTAGVGSIIGPVAGGVVMSLTAPWTFFLVLVGAHAVVVAYTGWRIVAREGVPVDEQGECVPWSTRASAMAVNMLRRPPRSLSRNGGSGPGKAA
ncbi:MAG: MFS transporter [Acidimicrobiia bacterium]|nr:MFS transporter [Acidimicrobiia bacterium]MYG72461.1 MFS transporter [Acidimicrobiia bacterium]